MSQGGTGAGSGGGGFNKVAALLAGGLGLAGLIIILTGGNRGDDGGGREVVLPTSQPQVVATNAPAETRPPSNTTALQTGTEKEQLRAAYPNSAVITVTAFGMPARVGIEAQNAGEVFTRGTYVSGNVNLACLPDQQYPNPCVSYLVVQRGANVTVTAGNSRAGFWPILEKLSGGGCEVPGSGGDRDVSCTLSLFQDADIVANYYGQDTPNGKYAFPKCPAGAASSPGAAASEWLKRCQ